MAARKGIGVFVVRGSLVVSVMFAAAGCKSRVERAYRECKSKTSEAFSNARKSDDPVASALEKGFEAMGQDLAGSLCDAMRTECQKAPEGQLCVNFLNQFNK